MFLMCMFLIEVNASIHQVTMVKHVISARWYDVYDDIHFDIVFTLQIGNMESQDGPSYAWWFVVQLVNWLVISGRWLTTKDGCLSQDLSLIQLSQRQRVSATPKPLKTSRSEVVFVGLTGLTWELVHRSRFCSLIASYNAPKLTIKIIWW